MSEVDIKYLREKNVPALLEKIAAEVVSRRPADPEAFIREKYAVGDEVPKPGESVKIYGTTLDPRTAIVLMASAYAGLAVSFTEVDESLTPADFLSVSPFRRSPVAEHQGSVAIEAAAPRYLLHSTPALPVSLKPRAFIESAFETLNTTLVSEALSAVSERVFIPRRANRPVDQVAVTAAVEKFKSFLPTVESSYFRESNWVVGKEPTLVDMALAAAIFVIQNVLQVQVATPESKLGVFWAAAQKQPFFTDSMKAFTIAALKVQKSG